MAFSRTGLSSTSQPTQAGPGARCHDLAASPVSSLPSQAGSSHPEVPPGWHDCRFPWSGGIGRATAPASPLLPGLSVFLHDDDQVFHTYSTYGRGLDMMGFGVNVLDLTALGRQEDWEEPKGRSDGIGRKADSPQIRYHDEYDD